MFWQIIQSILRHTLTSGGAVLVTKGLASQSDTDTAVGALMVLIGFGHSLWVKWKASKPSGGPASGTLPVMAAGFLLLSTAIAGRSQEIITIDAGNGLSAAILPGAQSNPASPPALSVNASTTNSAWSDFKKLGQDGWLAFAAMKPFTSNNVYQLQFGYGANLSSREQIEAVLLTVPVGKNLAIGFGGYHIGSEWADCSAALSYGIDYALPLIGTVHQFVGDGPAWSFKSSQVVNTAYTGLQKTWDVNSWLDLGIGGVLGNTSDRSGVDLIGGGHVIFHGIKINGIPW
ncbi:MAG TPA: hypothetical protein VG077_07085 [Verrucomicrobiae bacterium]|nr:hypothetical protein [Verrucomicrobiae bacterium]